ncbi:MAG TPA: sodium ion-translocating decarboxylase subunit beta, partial [Cycloclasticus sp.]|nr:sodium ion-translocating decarboxylase subunit beta [Cycloclasticus sp.]HIL93976.1 sodium ion-translocating decarboxylase subunit beta [Cycloclasticus sp.]
MDSGILQIWQSTGIANFEWGNVLMIGIGLLLIYLAIAKNFEPLLLLPIGFGGVLANIPIAGMSGPDGLLGILYHMGVDTGLFPLLIFMGVGALTDFGALIAMPSLLVLGAAAQFGIFATLLGALAMNMIPGMEFSLADASAIAIIGGADGPTAIFLASKLAPDLLGAIAVAAYSYMALVPLIQPPIMRALTTEAERKVEMKHLRHVTKKERIIFPLIILTAVILFLPASAPLVGMLAFGNLMRESGVVDRLSSTAQNELINIVTIFLGLAVGSKLSADKFLTAETLGILVLGMAAFSIGTAGGVLMGKVMHKVTGGKVNPLIGAAGVSAVPMAARVVNKVG